MIYMGGKDFQHYTPILKKSTGPSSTHKISKTSSEGAGR
jgi:hypothetical protein